MLDRLGIFPFAAVVATAIFLAREVLEAWRRRSTNIRKLRAVRVFVAAECERNHWTIKWLRGRIPSIKDALREKRVIAISTDPSGRKRLRTGGTEAQVPKAHSAALDKYLFEVASLDPKLFEVMQEVTTDVLELQHLCDGLVENASGDQFWLDGWTDYATGELDDISGSIHRLYHRCTGLELTKTRIR